MISIGKLYLYKNTTKRERERERETERQTDRETDRQRERETERERQRERDRELFLNYTLFNKNFIGINELLCKINLYNICGVNS